MNALEIEGKNIDEAIEKACRKFNVPREKLNIEILSEGSTGLLGLMRTKKARIKASLLSLQMAAEDKSKTTPEKKIAVAPAPEPEASEPMVPESGENVASKAKEILEGILLRMGVKFPVTLEETAEAITLNIKGDGSGLLIGKGGQTLDAIQYILNKAVGKSSKDKRMIVLDTEGYRDRRDEYLTTLAEKLGQKVKKSRKPVTINHLSARDRRVIHLALKSDETLTTKSRGEGIYRKIIIQVGKKD